MNQTERLQKKTLFFVDNNDAIYNTYVDEFSNSNKLDKPTFSIMHQNIQGLLSKLELLTITINDIKEYSNPDVICLTETFLKTNDTLNAKLPNYVLAAYYCRKKRRGGSCIFIKRGIQFEQLNSFGNISVANYIECCSIIVPCSKTIIISIYRPSSNKRHNLNVFFLKLERLLYKCITKYPKKKIILAGDFNINMLEKSYESTRLNDILKNYNLKLHITEPTRKKTCIDLIISNVKNVTGVTLPLYLSDHNTAQILQLFLKVTLNIPNTIFSFKRLYSEENIALFQSYLKSLSFQEVYKHSDINTAFNEFHDLFCLLYKLCFPIVKKKINTKCNLNWITRGLRRCCIAKRKLRFNYYSHSTTVNKKKYQQYNKLFKKCVNAAKRHVNNKYIYNHKNKCIATWNVIDDEINNRPYYCSGNISQLDYENEIITDPEKISNIFNEFFINLTNSKNNNCKNTNLTSLNNSIYLTPTDKNDIEKFIMTLNNTNAEGYDEISTKIVKACRHEISAVLAYLINLSMQTGRFPDKLKVSIVKPLYKKGNKALIDNYRPVTLIPILSKLFEKVLHSKLYSFFLKYNVIAADQYGFQRDKSTTLATFNLVNEILHKINANNYVTALFFDMSKAFDFVSHSLLMEKIEQYGVRGPAYDWTKSYLENRSQTVEISGINMKRTMKTYKSKAKINKYGVPQGSVLGPLLFVIYINDISKITHHRTILFADDITVIVATPKGRSLSEHESEINNVLQLTIEWLNNNNLNININKTNFINFNDINNLKIILNDIVINKIDCTTFLGIDIDNKLNWKNQVERVCNKLNRFSYALGKLTRVASRQAAITAYYAYVESVLRYGVLVWGNSTDANKAFIAQKKCIRAIMMMTPDMSCMPLFKSLKILPLPCLYILEASSFVFQNQSLFRKTKDNTSRNLRNPNALVFDCKPKSARFRKNCYAMCTTIWNKLPCSLKNIKLKHRFKKAIKSWLMQHLFYSMKDYIDHKINECEHCITVNVL